MAFGVTEWKGIPSHCSQLFLAQRWDSTTRWKLSFPSPPAPTLIFFSTISVHFKTLLTKGNILDAHDCQHSQQVGRSPELTRLSILSYICTRERHWAVCMTRHLHVDTQVCKTSDSCLCQGFFSSSSTATCALVRQFSVDDTITDLEITT